MINLHRLGHSMGGRLTVFLIIAAASLVLRLPHLDKPLIKDEGRVYKCNMQEYGEMLKFIVKKEAHPPLYYYMAKEWSRVSRSYFWMRLLSVIFGALTPAVVYLIALQMYREDKIAILAGCISSISPNLIFISQMLRSYSAATFFSVCAAMFFIKYREDKSIISLSAYALASLMGIYISYFSALVVLAIVLFVFFRIKDFTKREMLHFFAANIIIALLYAIWIPFMFEQMRNTLTNAESYATLMMAKSFGMYIGGVHIGAIVRTLSGIFQVDYALFSNTRIHTRMALPALIGLVTAISAAACYITIKGSRYLTSAAKMAGATLFLSMMVFVPFGIAAILKAVKVFDISQRYMGSCAALFSIVMAAFIFSINKMTLRYLALLAMVTFFAFRMVSVWTFNDKEYKVLDDYIASKRSAMTIVSYEIDSFKNNDRYRSMRLIELKSGEEALAKKELANTDSFYFVEFKRPIVIMKDNARYRAVTSELTSGYELVEYRAIDDVISVGLYRKKR